MTDWSHVDTRLFFNTSLLIYFTELQETFKLFDRDNDGYLTARELGEAMRAMAQHPTEQEIQDLTKKSEGEDGRYTPEEVTKSR